MASSDIQRPEALGKAIAYRLALREEAVAQVRVVDILARSNVAAELVFCGSAALHGCYLHGRRVQTLDFMARPETITRLILELRASGILLKQTQAHHEYGVVVRNGSTVDLTVKVRMHPRYALDLETEYRPFIQGKHQSVALRTVQLSELVLAKLGHLYLRERPLDYFDVWLASKHSPDAGPHVQLLLTTRRNSGSSHVPPEPFDATFLMKRLLRMEETWAASLAALVNSPPDFETVRKDLNQWLPLFDGTV